MGLDVSRGGDFVHRTFGGPIVRWSRIFEDVLLPDRASGVLQGRSVSLLLGFVGLWCGTTDKVVDQRLQRVLHAAGAF